MVCKLSIIGLMSGTSLDGADAALVDFWQEEGRICHRLRHFLTLDMPAALQRQVRQAIGEGTAAQVARLNVAMGRFLAQAAEAVLAASQLDRCAVDLIGSHGQTLWHIPGEATLQVGEPAIIAEVTGITTVADFRPADVAAGGQGAPLVPFADRTLYLDPSETTALLNIGGIANLTLLDPAHPDQILAFDTGPGNMVIDAVAGRLCGQPFDPGGAIAARGRVSSELLAELLQHEFFAQRPPKSTGREMFGEAYCERLLARAQQLSLEPADVLATATALTAHSIAGAIERQLPEGPRRVRASGGGVHNSTLMKMLADRLGDIKLEVLPDADAKEAIAFALLAYCAALGLNNHIAATTGAARSLVLGKIVPGRNYGRLLLSLTDQQAARPPIPITESPHPQSDRLDTLTSRDLAKLMADEEYAVAAAVCAAAEALGRAIELVSDRLRQGGRLFYVGAGTSGRLGVLDAAECPPTFSTDPKLVQALLAGGPAALQNAIEGAEDDAAAGTADLRAQGLEAKDVVVGLSASGGAPYVHGALKYARSLGCATLIVTSARVEPQEYIDLEVPLIVGPEVLSGSTRMKAGTATKVALNILSTGVMVKLGKVYSNLMVDVHVTNQKLRRRALRILAQTTGAGPQEAQDLLSRAGGSVKLAIAMQRLGLGADEARQRLAQSSGRLRQALELAGN